jgi:hypothetical protein
MLKLMMEAIEEISNPISRIVLFTLCNRFYFENENVIMEKWPYYGTQVMVCEELMLRKDEEEGEEDPFWL